MKLNSNIEVAIFACGCFWSKEYFFQRQFGVLASQVGYIGGHSLNPSYSEVCKKESGHAEAIRISFDPEKTSFEKLAKAFFTIHDAQIDRSTNGGQYRSAIFYTNEKQKIIALKQKQELLTKGKHISTQIEAAGKFWLAETRHQKYCERKGLIPDDKYKQIF